MTVDIRILGSNLYPYKFNWETINLVAKSLEKEILKIIDSKLSFPEFSYIERLILFELKKWSQKFL